MSRGAGSGCPALSLPRLFWPQLEVDLLKAENDRLKVAPGPSSGPPPGQAPGSSALSSPRRSLGLALTHSFSPSLTDTGTYLGDEEQRVWSTTTPSHVLWWHLPWATEVTVPEPSGCQYHGTRSVVMDLWPRLLSHLGLLFLLCNT